MNKAINHSLFTEYDIYLFKEGKNHRLFEKLGSHFVEVDGEFGVYFAVWAPNAISVAVIGTFNDWKIDDCYLSKRTDDSGIWEGFVSGVEKGSLYKYHITPTHGEALYKSDPFAFYCQQPSETASIIWDLDYDWQDKKWLKKRRKKNWDQEPISVYELHLASWMKPEDGREFFSYEELGEKLVPYVKKMGFTHVEFLPVMEHPYLPSWGYQVTGYFAATSRYGEPQGLMALIEMFHEAEIGVILDWVPSHFPTDDHGLGNFDGTHLFNHADSRKGFHPDWKTYIFDFERKEVCSFLLSNALFWIEKYHIDGIRVDAVASMLYLDYSREDGQWIPNKHGGNHNLEAIDFLKNFNLAIQEKFPDVLTIAEESSAWEGVSIPVDQGGLGFSQKWMMGWMNDTFEYIKRDPIHRKYHHNDLTFSIVYAFSEKFMLPFSHDEVVHGKASLIYKMPGEEWEKFANLRLLFGYMFTHPGTKLLFMGDEFGQTNEWNFEQSLSWGLLDHPIHRKLLEWVKELNLFYQATPALFERQFQESGFQWINADEREWSILSYMRIGKKKEDLVVVVCNFTPIGREHYEIGVPFEGQWKELLNSDEEQFGGTSKFENKNLVAYVNPLHNQPSRLNLTIPPLSVVILGHAGVE